MRDEPTQRDANRRNREDHEEDHGSRCLEGDGSRHGLTTCGMTSRGRRGARSILAPCPGDATHRGSLGDSLGGLTHGLKPTGMRQPNASWGF
jgi:hypothetical protein